jgi:branched-subunit amino acid transport protein
MSRPWLAIALSGVGTFAMRLSFLAAAHRMVTLPDWVHRLLRQIPPAALAALVVPALVRADGTIDLFHPRLAAGLAAAVVAWRTRNIALTLVVGMAVLLILEAF